MPTSAMRIAGIDEAGRGPLAGPVVAAAVLFPVNYTNEKIKDSKKLSRLARDTIYEEIVRDALEWSVIAVGHQRIRAFNILGATKLAMRLAAQRVRADLFLVDGNQRIGETIPHQTVIGGDAIHVQISAASIVAKVFRDRLMARLDTKYPGFGLAQHSGYPTKQHLSAISKLGPVRIHRADFRGVKEFYEIGLRQDQIQGQARSELHP